MYVFACVFVCMHVCVTCVCHMCASGGGEALGGAGETAATVAAPGDGVAVGWLHPGEQPGRRTRAVRVSLYVHTRWCTSTKGGSTTGFCNHTQRTLTQSGPRREPNAP